MQTTAGAPQLAWRTGGFQGRGPEALRLLHHHAGPRVRTFYADLKFTPVRSCKRAEGSHVERDHSGTSAAAAPPARGQGWSTSPSAPAPQEAGEVQGCWLSLLSKKKLKAPGPQPRAPLLTSELCGFSLVSSYFTRTCCGRREMSPPNNGKTLASPSPPAPARPPSDHNFSFPF